MGSQYKVANQRMTLKVLPLPNLYFKTSFMRAPLAPAAVFGYEQMIDELAYAANMDPVAFRLQNITSNASETQRGVPLTWDRWKNVLNEVTKISNWKPKVANSVKQSGNVVTGRGIALGGFAGTMTGDRRGHLGEQEDRQDHGHPSLRRTGHGLERVPGRRREPGRRAA